MKRRIKAIFMAVLVLLGLKAAKLPTAHADVDNAMQTATEMGIDLDKVRKSDFANADFAINIEENLANVTKGEGLPKAYAECGFVPNTALVQAGLNEMRGVAANANIANAFTKRENFKYVSMLTMFTNDEKQKEIGAELDKMLTEYLSIVLAGDPNKMADAAQDILNYARENEALLGVGGTQAIASDLSVVVAMADAYKANSNSFGERYEEWDKQVKSALNNADAIALSEWLFAQLNNQSVKCR